MAPEREPIMTTTTPQQVTACRRSLLWRLHLWAAIFASPFALIACLTGLLYVFTPQIERALHGHLDTVTPLGQQRPLDELVQTAREVAPQGWTLHSVMPAHRPEDSTRVAFMPPRPAATGAGTTAGHAGHAGHGASSATATSSPPFLRPNFGVPSRAMVVYLDPYSGQVLGQLAESERFATWARQLHSSLLQGDGWRWMIELAASWMMVMLVTGVYLWWPTARQGLLPSGGWNARTSWRQWHAFLGVALGLVSFVILATGLTWSQYAGGQVKAARDAAGQAPPRLPASVRSSVPPSGKMLTWQQAHEAIRRDAPDIALQIMSPMGPNGVWRSNQVDKSAPTRRFDMLSDAYTGERLLFLGWDDQTAFSKATAIGIPFHRGEFGLWNQLLLAVFGVGILFSLISGWVMVLMRYRTTGRFWPRLLPGAWRHASPWAWLAGLLSLSLMPVLAVSALLPMTLEVLWARRLRSSNPT